MKFDLKKAMLSTAIILPAMSLSISNAASIETLIINDTVNFRVQANKYSTKIDTLTKGTKVEYLGTSDSWYKIKYNGQVGYIYSSYADKYTDANNHATSTNNLIKYVNCSSLNCRSGIGTSYPVVKVLSQGTKVEVISTTNGWSKILVGGVYGYVNDSYLSTANTTDSAAKDDTSASEDKTVKYYKYVNATSLNFREEPNSSATRICSLSNGTKVGVISISNNWAKIKYGSYYGYVNDSYLSNSLSSSNSSSSLSTSEKLEKIVSIAKSKIGCRYVRGSEGPNTFDCTGITTYLYKQVGITLPRDSSAQSKAGSYVSKKNLKPGDLVFLDTKGNDGKIDHASIYIGNDTIVHANSVAGKVTTAKLTTNYYINAYVSARRIID